MRISDWSSDVCSSDLLRHGALEQITRDHSLLEEMIARGHYSREDAQRLVRKNIVTRALGVENEDRKSVVSGKSVSVRVDLGGRRIIKKKKISIQYRITRY